MIIKTIINQSINQSVSQSINQSINRLTLFNEDNTQQSYDWQICRSRISSQIGIGRKVAFLEGENWRNPEKNPKSKDTTLNSEDQEENQPTYHTESSIWKRATLVGEKLLSLDPIN